MTQTRLPDWEEKLSIYISKCEKKKFAWGKFDCVIFSVGAISAMYGKNFLKNEKIKYTDKKTGLELIKKQGKGSLWDLIDKHANLNGFSSKNTARTRHGNLVGTKTKDEEELLGVMQDDGTMVVAQKEGLVRLPFSYVQKRWNT